MSYGWVIHEGIVLPIFRMPREQAGEEHASYILST